MYLKQFLFCLPVLVWIGEGGGSLRNNNKLLSRDILPLNWRRPACVRTSTVLTISPWFCSKTKSSVSWVVPGNACRSHSISRRETRILLFQARRWLSTRLLMAPTRSKSIYPAKVEINEAEPPQFGPRSLAEGRIIARLSIFAQDLRNLQSRQSQN